jgi:hypothetical protein
LQVVQVSPKGIFFCEAQFPRDSTLHMPFTPRKADAKADVKTDAKAPLIDFSGCDLGDLDVKGADFTALPLKVDADTKMDAVRNLPFAKFFDGSASYALEKARGSKGKPEETVCCSGARCNETCWGTRGCRTAGKPACGDPSERYGNAGHWNYIYSSWYAFWMNESKAKADAPDIRWEGAFLPFLSSSTVGFFLPLP